WTSFAGSQLRYNLLERTPEREWLPQARAFDQAVMAWAPLAAGTLTGKYRRGESGRLARGGPEAEREARPRTAGREIAAEGGWSPAQVALAWLRGR
ncbi:aldo/keto reductase, partial [Streptomyces lavendulocolor]